MSEDSQLVVKTFDELTLAELYGIMQLRSQVFVVEQSCIFLDQDGVDTLPQTLHAFFPGDVRTMQDSHGAEVGRSLAPMPTLVCCRPISRTGRRSSPVPAASVAS